MWIRYWSYVDEYLTFETHIVTKVNKANSIIDIIRRSYIYGNVFIII